MEGIQVLWTMPGVAMGRPYEIRIRGVLDEQWSDWLAGLTITPQADGSALLVGPLRDQAALHGLLNRIRDIGLLQLSVERKSTCP